MKIVMLLPLAVCCVGTLNLIKAAQINHSSPTHRSNMGNDAAAAFTLNFPIDHYENGKEFHSVHIGRMIAEQHGVEHDQRKVRERRSAQSHCITAISYPRNSECCIPNDGQMWQVVHIENVIQYTPNATCRISRGSTSVPGNCSVAYRNHYTLVWSEPVTVENIPRVCNREQCLNPEPVNGVCPAFHLLWQRVPSHCTARPFSF